MTDITVAALTGTDVHAWHGHATRWATPERRCDPNGPAPVPPIELFDQWINDPAYHVWIATGAHGPAALLVIRAEGGEVCWLFGAPDRTAPAAAAIAEHHQAVTGTSVWGRVRNPDLADELAGGRIHQRGKGQLEWR